MEQIEAQLKLIEEKIAETVERLDTLEEGRQRYSRIVSGMASELSALKYRFGQLANQRERRIKDLRAENEKLRRDKEELQRLVDKLAARIDELPDGD